MMNPLSSQNNNNRRTVWSLMVVFILSTTFLGPVQTVKASPVMPVRPKPFTYYGFEVTGFSPEEEAIIRKTLEMYAQSLGGAKKLRKIIFAFSGEKNRKITYNPNIEGAFSTMELSPTVFSIERAQAANFSCYAARNETSHAQIVIGHEIAHLLLLAVEWKTGVNWVEGYAERVSRDWTSLNPTAPKEEAVTNLSLKVLQMDYFFSLNNDLPESDPQVVAEIDTWTTDFLRAAQQLDVH